MLIGELSMRTGTPTRMLRYYEKQGLLVSERHANGYRDYTEDAVERVHRIRNLIDAGVPTAIIAQLVPCLEGSSDIVLHDDCPDILAMLEQQRDQMSNRINCLTQNRDAISEYVDVVRAGLGARV